MQRVEATSGASRTARGSTGTLAVHGVGEETMKKRNHKKYVYLLIMAIL
jgi:hypothetical protein